jgi:hypothetical protein
MVQVIHAVREEMALTLEDVVMRRTSLGQFGQPRNLAKVADTMGALLGWDENRNRPNFLFVAIDDIYLPYAASNFYSAQRKTHVQYLTTVDYAERV